MQDEHEDLTDGHRGQPFLQNNCSFLFQKLDLFITSLIFAYRNETGSNNNDMVDIFLELKLDAG